MTKTTMFFRRPFYAFAILPTVFYCLILYFHRIQCVSDRNPVVSRNFSQARIPPIIHITTKDVRSALTEQNIGEWQRLNPGYDVRIYSDLDMRRLFQNELPQYLELYDFLYSHVERVDFWRYMIIYVYGGVYADADVTPLISIDSWHQVLYPKDAARKAPTTIYNPVQVICSAEVNNSFNNRWKFQQGVLYGPPGHWIFKRCAELILANVRNDLRVGTLGGRTAVERTGPAVFSDAVHEYLRVPARDESGPAFISRDVLLEFQDRFYRGDIVNHHQTGTWRYPDMIARDEAVFQQRLNEWKAGKWPSLE